MICNKCGQRLDIGSVFCTNCGSMITASTEDINEQVDTIFNEFKNNKINNMEHEDTPKTPDYYKKRIVKKISEDSVPTNKEVEEEISASMSYAPNSYYAEETEVKRGGKMKSFFIGLLIFILLLGSAAFAAYFAYNRFIGTSTNEYINAITKLNTKINKANNDMAAIIDKDQKVLAVKDITNQIPSAVDAFNEINKDYSKIIAPSVYANNNEKLGEAIRLNKLLYQQMGLILGNPAGPDMQTDIDQLSRTIDDCISNYMSIKVKGLDFSLPNTMLAITSRIQPWVKQKQAEYSKIMTLITAYSKYFDDISKLFVAYDSASAEFNLTIRNIRSGQEQWDKLFIMIDNSEKIINDVKSQHDKLSVPSDLKNINKRFGPILDDLLAYYGKLKVAAQTEKKYNEEAASKEITEPAEQTEQPRQDEQTQQGQTGSQNNGRLTEKIEKINRQQEIDTLYEEADKLYQTASLNYQQFALDLKADKDKYLDPEYVLKIKSGK